MAIIQCSEKCKFQIDGYCQLEKFSTVNSITDDCPYFTVISLNDRDRLSQRSDSYKL